MTIIIYIYVYATGDADNFLSKNNGNLNLFNHNYSNPKDESEYQLATIGELADDVTFSNGDYDTPSDDTNANINKIKNALNKNQLLIYNIRLGEDGAPLNTYIGQSPYYFAYLDDSSNNYVSIRHHKKNIKHSQHRQITKRINRKLVSYKVKHRRKNHKRESKWSNKKLVNSIKHDKKVLANKHARHFNRLIKRINSKHIRKSAKRVLSKKINRKANRKYLNAYKDLVKNQKLLK